MTTTPDLPADAEPLTADEEPMTAAAPGSTLLRIQLRRDTADAWTAANPVLGAGEQGLETDTGKQKVGNGANAWGDLPYEVSRPDLALKANASTVAGKQDKATLGADAATALQTPGNALYVAGRAASETAAQETLGVAIGRVKKASRFHLSGTPNSTNSSVQYPIFRLPVLLCVASTRWRLHWRNHNVTAAGDQATTGAQTITGAYLGEHAKDALGAGTGNFKAAPVKVVDSAATPADGSEWISPWVTDPALQFKAGVEHLLSFGLVGATGFTWSRGVVPAFYRSTSQANSTTDVAAQTITISGSAPVYGDLWIEYEFTSTVPVGLHVGDSLTDGLGSTLGKLGNWTNHYAMRESIAAADLATSGITLQTLASFGATHPYWTRYGLGAAGATDRWVPDYVVLWAMTNDIAGGLRTDVQIKADFLTVVNLLRDTFGIQRIYTALVAPRAFTGAAETLRQTMNDWLRTRPGGVLDAFEFDRAVASAADSTVIDSTYNSDGTHMKVPGYARIARAVPGRLATVR